MGMTDTEYILLTLLQSGQVKPEHVYAGYVCNPGAVMGPQIADEVLIYLSHFREDWAFPGGAGSKSSALKKRAGRDFPYKPGTGWGKLGIYYDVFPVTKVEQLLEEFPTEEPHILHALRLEDVLDIVGITEPEPYGAEHVLEDLLDRQEVSSSDVTQILQHWALASSLPLSSVWGMSWFVRERAAIVNDGYHPFYNHAIPLDLLLRISERLDAMPPNAIRHTFLYRHLTYQLESMSLLDLLGD